MVLRFVQIWQDIKRGTHVRLSGDMEGFSCQPKIIPQKASQPTKDLPDNLYFEGSKFCHRFAWLNLSALHYWTLLAWTSWCVVQTWQYIQADGYPLNRQYSWFWAPSECAIKNGGQSSSARNQGFKTFQVFGRRSLTWSFTSSDWLNAGCLSIGIQDTTSPSDNCKSHHPFISWLTLIPEVDIQKLHPPL